MMMMNGDASSSSSVTHSQSGTGMSPNKPSSRTSSRTSSTNINDSHHRQAALDEAKAVLEAIGGESTLDGFNLLTVVANPRTSSLLGPSSTAIGGTSSSTATASSSSFHGRYNSNSNSSNSNSNNNTALSSSDADYASSSAAAAGGGGGGGMTGSGVFVDTSTTTSMMLADTYHSLEMTLYHVTEHMEALNMVLEDWSRQLLDPDPNNSGTHADDQLLESVLTELPAELQTLEVQQLQAYLETSGVVAHSFHQRCIAMDQQQQQQQHQHHQPQPLLYSNDHENENSELTDLASIVMKEVEAQVPTQFFCPDFDLTDPTTFRELLLWMGEGDNARSGSASANTIDSNVVATAAATATVLMDDSETKDGPIQQWFPLPPPDTFSFFLDQVELALLQQVRSKSDAFFEESLRFAQLQEWIQSLLAQTMTLQSVIQQLQSDFVDPMVIIPTSDAQRRVLLQLQHLLEVAGELVVCKHSIAGYLSAQDDLSAIEQIQYGRRLLTGNNYSIATPPPNTAATTTTVTTSTTTSATGMTASEEGGEEKVELQRLVALQSVADQLNQYENLVVTNLRDELVEILLDWNTTTTTITSSSTSSSSPAMLGSSMMYATTSSASALHQQGRVREILGALRMCHGVSKARDAYGNRLQDMIRMTVRTIVSEFATDMTRISSSSNNNNNTPTSTNSMVVLSSGATTMSLDRFLDCIDMMFEQLLSMISSACSVNEFCLQEGVDFDDGADDEDLRENDDKVNHPHDQTTPDSSNHVLSPMSSIITAAAELSSKSISELLRLRKEAHSLVTLDEMKRIWDKCSSFTAQLEDFTGHKASALRSTLLAQAKAFIERKHESNMSALVAALDSERWMQCDVSVERQAALSRLCYGRTVMSMSLSRDGDDTTASGVSALSISSSPKAPEVEIEGRKYKVVWSCLLLMEMVISDLIAAAHFSSLASGLVAKVAELLRLFNTRTTQLVLGAGAIHSAARLKSINAKHLSLVTQCLRLVGSTLPHVRAGLMAQLPPKQHTLLTVLDQIKKEYVDHNEKILNKFVTIIGGIVEHGLAPKLRGTDFDLRANQLPPPSPANGSNKTVSCCVFLEGISTNTRKMHQVLSSLLPPDHLQDAFSRIFAFVDQTVPSLFVAAAAESLKSRNPTLKFSSPSLSSAADPAATPGFAFPTSDAGKRRLLLEVDTMTSNLNGLEGVRPWDFTIASVLRMRLEIMPENDRDEVSIPVIAAATATPTTLLSLNTTEDEGESRPEDDCVGNGAEVGDLHTSDVVSETGTEVTSESLTTTDTIPLEDIADSEHSPSSPLTTAPSLQSQSPPSMLQPPALVDSDASAPLEETADSTQTPEAVPADHDPHLDPTPASEITSL